MVARAAHAAWRGGGGVAGRQSSRVTGQQPKARATGHWGGDSGRGCEGDAAKRGSAMGQQSDKVLGQPCNKVLGVAAVVGPAKAGCDKVAGQVGDAGLGCRAGGVVGRSRAAGGSEVGGAAVVAGATRVVRLGGGWGRGGAGQSRTGLVRSTEGASWLAHWVPACCMQAVTGFI